MRNDFRLGKQAAVSLSRLGEDGYLIQIGPEDQTVDFDSLTAIKSYITQVLAINLDPKQLQLCEITSTFNSIAIYTDGALEQVDEAIGRTVADAVEVLNTTQADFYRSNILADSSITTGCPKAVQIIEIPVWYGCDSMEEEPSNRTAAHRSSNSSLSSGSIYRDDLASIAVRKKMTTADVIALHSSVTYRVQMIGFLPGFPYLTGLPLELATPRYASPRTRIPSRSVAIGGSQSGIYPQDSPGGWHLLGRTPLEIFDPCADQPTLLKAGDFVHFHSIDESAYKQLRDSQRRTSKQFAQGVGGS